MTMNEFNTLCEARLIDPDIAFENANIQQALCIRDDGYVVEVLDTEF